MQKRKTKKPAKKEPESNWVTSTHALAEAVEEIILKERRAKKPQLELETRRRLENMGFNLRVCAASVFRLNRMLKRIETELQFQQNLDYDMTQISQDYYKIINENNKTNRTR